MEAFITHLLETRQAKNALRARQRLLAVAGALEIIGETVDR